MTTRAQFAPPALAHLPKPVRIQAVPSGSSHELVLGHLLVIADQMRVSHDVVLLRLDLACGEFDRCSFPAKLLPHILAGWVRVPEVHQQQLRPPHVGAVRDAEGGTAAGAGSASVYQLLARLVHFRGVLEAVEPDRNRPELRVLDVGVLRIPPDQVGILENRFAS